MKKGRSSEASLMENRINRQGLLLRRKDSGGGGNTPKPRGQGKRNKHSSASVLSSFIIHCFI